MSLDQYITTSLVICLVTLILYLWKRSSNLPPGPWGIPILGYFPFLKDKPYEQFAEMAQRYGNVFSFRTTGGKLVVILHGYKTIKEVLVGRAEEFLGKPFENNLVAWVSNGLGISQEEGPAWKEQRKFFLQAAKPYGFGKQEMEAKIQDEIQILLEELRATGGKPTNLHLHVCHTTNSIIGHILFRKRLEKKDPVFKELCEGLDSVIQMFGANNVFSIGWFFENITMRFFSGCKKAVAGKRILLKMMDDIIDDHIRSLDPEHPKDFLDAYLLHRIKLQQEGKLENSTFTMARLKAIVFNMFFEGTESVAEAIQGFLLELSRHVEAQKKAQQELDSVVGRERLPSWLDKPNLPYVDALILELYRTNMPFNTTALNSNFEETTIQGYRIPKRSIVLASLWSLNNDPEIFKNPSKFDPGRYLGPDGKRIKQEGPFTFGIGKRACIGESLGQIEVFLFVASIVQHFTLHPANDEASLVKLVPRK